MINAKKIKKSMAAIAACGVMLATGITAFAVNPAPGYRVIGSVRVDAMAGYNGRNAYANYTATANVDARVSGMVYYVGSNGEIYSQSFNQKSYGEFSKNYPGDVTRVTATFYVITNDGDDGTVTCDTH